MGPPPGVSHRAEPPFPTPPPGVVIGQGGQRNSFPMAFGSGRGGGRQGRGGRGGRARSSRSPRDFGGGGGRQGHRRGGGGRGNRGGGGGGGGSQLFKRTMVEDPWAPLIKRGAAATGRHAPDLAPRGVGSRQTQHLPVQPQLQVAPGHATTLPASLPGGAGRVQQLPPPPGVTRAPLPSQSQLVAQLGVGGQVKRRPGWGANADNAAAVSAEMLLASAPKGPDGTPLGRIFVGGLPQVRG